MLLNREGSCCTNRSQTLRRNGRTGGVQQYGPKVWQELQDFWMGRQSIPRLGQPEDVADVVGFLCGREGRWITGSKISANGGSIAIV
jgi:NAD(P)-dependent dehydrogenase (short-subunit alcohol dehydrogenase family)